MRRSVCLDRAFDSVIGKRTVAVRSGGSIPVVSDLARSGAPVLLTGIGLPDDGLHSPNEKLDLQQLWDGINVFGRLFDLFGASESLVVARDDGRGHPGEVKEPRDQPGAGRSPSRFATSG